MWLWSLGAFQFLGVIQPLEHGDVPTKAAYMCCRSNVQRESLAGLRPTQRPLDLGLSRGVLEVFVSWLLSTLGDQMDSLVLFFCFRLYCPHCQLGAGIGLQRLGFWNGRGQLGNTSNPWW